MATIVFVKHVEIESQVNQMADEENKLYYCEKCKKTKRASEFYTSNNLEKYPNDGKFNMCKDCLTMHVNNWDPDTYLWILQEADVPYIPDEWNKLLASYTREGKKITSKTIIGRYLSKMKLAQYKKYRWEDTKLLQELAEKKIEETMTRQGYSASEITQTLMTNTFTVPDRVLEQPQYQDFSPAPVVEEPDDDFDDQLTDEDKAYLRLKWGKIYKPEEWVWLEQLYNEMMESYDIQTAGHIDTLKLICKTSLKANQLIDIGDIDGYQKMSKVYDSLMKSGKFTAAQNKAENGEFIDSISELVSLCERDGFIPRYYIDSPKDKVDETLFDMKSYTKTLVTEELGLGDLIENAVKEMVKQEAKEDEEDLDEEFADDLTYEEINPLQDKDFIEYNDFIENEEDSDQHKLESILEGGE